MCAGVAAARLGYGDSAALGVFCVIHRSIHGKNRCPSQGSHLAKLMFLSAVF